MKCPRCQTKITEAARHCTGCGYRFGEVELRQMELFLQIRGERQALGKLGEQFQACLRSLDGRLDALQDLLQPDLESGAGGAKTVPTGPAGPATTSPPAPAEARPPHPQAPITAPKIAPPAVLPAADSPAAAATAATPKPPPAAPRPRPAQPAMEVRLGQKWLLIAGVIIIVLAVGYFLKYSFDRGWVGPAGRVAMAFLFGIGLLVVGEVARKSYRAFGLCLAGGGIAVLYFATFASFQIYALFGQTLAFAIMVLVTALASTLAIFYDNKWIASLGLIGGFLTPVLLSTGVDNQIALMSYMTLLNLGLLAIAFLKRWPLLNALGFICTYILYIGWQVTHYQPVKFWPAIIFLNLFYLIYTLLPFAYQNFRGRIDSLASFLIIVPNTMLAFIMSAGMIEDRFGTVWVSVITVLYALIFLILATFLVGQGRQKLSAFVVVLSKAMLFLIITVPIIFSDHWITVFWAAQALALLWMSLRLGKLSLVIGATLLMVLAASKFLFWDYFENFNLDFPDLSFSPNFTDGLTERWLTTLVVLGVAWLFRRMLRHDSSQLPQPVFQKVLRVLLAIGWATLLFASLNIEVAGFFHQHLPNGRFAAMSVLWTFYSVGLMILGFRQRLLALRWIALSLFLVTILKVFLWDMAEVSTPYRIISFMVLGLVLVGVSFLYHRFKDKLAGGEPNPPEKESQP